MTTTTDTDIQRAARGRFAAGQSGNPAGTSQRLTIEQRIERALSTHGVGLIERAFVEAKTDNLVLAGLLNFLGSCQNAALDPAAQN